jgi:hypothetical protein
MLPRRPAPLHGKSEIAYIARVIWRRLGHMQAITECAGK